MSATERAHETVFRTGRQRTSAFQDCWRVAQSLSFCYCHRMTLHFAYGSNMSRRLMRVRCPEARALSTTTLRDWQFVISPDGFASLVRQPGGCVHGVVWRLSMRDLAAVNAYESVQSGLYVRRALPVALNPSATALVYIARRPGTGIPRPGYINLVVEAACEWGLPQSYIRALERWGRSGWCGARARDVGEVG